MNTQAKRFNQDKPDLHYLHVWYDALCEVARVCQAGAEKYERGNYLLGQPYSQLLGCAERHIGKFGDYQRPDYDPESNRHHIAHAIWNLLQLLQHEVGASRSGPMWDDRLKPPGWPAAGEHNACTEFETIPPEERPWNASTHGLIRPTAGEPGHGYPPHVIEPADLRPLKGDDDSRDPADYEQETADMMAAAQGTGRKAHPPWQDAVEAWLTGPPDGWDPNEHLIEVTDLSDTERRFVPGTPEHRCRCHQAKIRAKL